MPLFFRSLTYLSLNSTTLAIQDLANRSWEKSDKLRSVEDGLHELQAKDRKIGEKIYEIVDLRN